MTRRYRELVVAGPPWELGRQIGEAAREEIRGFVSSAIDLVRKTTEISTDRALRLAAVCVDEVRSYAPHLLEELRGMSQSAGVSLDELMLLQIRNQLTADVDSGCTSFSLDSGATGERRKFLGQNWDSDPALDAFTLVLTRVPERGPPLLTVTQAGLIAYIGVNAAGIGVCLNTLPAPSRAVGVPHYFTLRRVYESTSLGEAVEAVRQARRAIPANLMMTTPEGPADLEVTVDDVHVLRDDSPTAAGDGIVTHTNHCLHPALRSINDSFDELIQSGPRLRRIDALLRAGTPLTFERLAEALRDHADYPHSICRHASEDPPHGHWETVFSVIIDPDQREMHVARGTPCGHAYERYCLPG